MTTPAAPPSTPPAPPVNQAPTAPATAAPDGDWQGYALAAVVGILAPLSFNIGYFLREDKKRTFLAGMDLVVVLLCVLALLNWRRIPALIQAVPKTVWLFVATAGLALIGMVAVGTTTVSELLSFKMEIGKVLIGNYVEYLIVAPVLVAMLIDGRKNRLGAIMKGLLIAGLIASISGCVDFWNPGLLDIEVAGLFDHRNLLGGVFAMLAPLAAAMVVFERQKWQQLTALAVLVLGLWCQTTAGALLGIVGGIFAVVAVGWAVRKQYRRCSFKLITLPILVVGVLTLNHLLSPRDPDSRERRGYTLQPRSQLDAAFESIAPWKYHDPADYYSPKTRLSDRARRWQAQINLLRKNPFGCGTGLYQKKIEKFYGSAYPKPSAKTDDHPAWGSEADEPGSIGMYEVVASEMGLLGLAAFLAMLLAALARAGALLIKAATLPAEPPLTTTTPTAAADEKHGVSAAAARYPLELYAGMYSFALLTGAALFGIFHNPVASRGPAGLFAIALALTITLLPRKSAA